MAMSLLAAGILAATSATAPLKLASPGLTLVDVPADTGAFYSDHLAQKLSLRGIRVVTPKEIQALLGLERQRQLLGCSELSGSCFTELANALGADGIVIGTIAKLGDRYHLDVKVLGASTGTQLGLYSGEADDEEAVIEELTRAADALAPALLRALGKEPSGDTSIEAPVPPSGALHRRGPLVGALAALDVLTRSVSPEILGGYAFRHLEISARVRVGPVMGLGVEVAYAGEAGPVRLFAGGRVDAYLQAGALGLGILAGVRAPLVAGFGGVGQVSVEELIAPAGYKSGPTVVASLGLDWRF